MSQEDRDKLESMSDEEQGELLARMEQLVRDTADLLQDKTVLDYMNLEQAAIGHKCVDLMTSANPMLKMLVPDDMLSSLATLISYSIIRYAESKDTSKLDAMWKEGK